jgi:spermidine synthase
MVRTYLRFLTLAFAGAVLLPTVTTVGSLLHRRQTIPLGETALALWIAAGLTFLFQQLLRRLEPTLDADARDQAAFLDAMPERWAGLAIALAAGASLLLELAVIRWQGAVFEFFAFYKNFGLLTCFAGLGLGYALADRDRIPLLLTIPVLAGQFVLLIALRYGLPPWRLESVTALPVVEQLAMGARSARSVAQGISVYFFLLVVFFATALAFIPVGQVCGRLMARRAHLRAYGLNLAGSVAGVGVMFVASALWTPPLVWFALGFLALLALAVPRRATLLAGCAAATAAAITLVWPVNPNWQRVYSPYQLLELGYSDQGLMVIRAAGHYYQRVHDLATPTPTPPPTPGAEANRQVREYYDFPYRLSPAPADVAVVGAGAGNDVAAALRAGAGRVDAIEIDPAILAAGRANHPERPYRDGRVRAITDDARSFLRTTARTYDVIVYGLLDSHTLLSHASSVRLDSFVYTVERFREARARLKPGGLLVVSFSVMSNALGRKMYEMLRQAFDGAPPAVVQAGYDGAVVFVQAREGGYALAPAVLAATAFRDEAARYSNPAIVADVSTDDWPFFYMPRRVFPASYLALLGLVLLGAAALTRGFIRERPRLAEAPMFLLGAGFMLVETKAITEMGLTFGNTWQVIGIVIACILGMAFLANAAVARFDVRRPQLAYVLLIASLAISWIVMGRGGMPSTTLGRAGTAVLLTVPMLFSGVVFSTLLALRRAALAPAMAANLLGAMCGGLLEYNAMYFGFLSLHLVALAFYAAAFLYTLVTQTSNIVDQP